ncbi:MAG: transposase [Candidatus Omnitrophica bacterium]|nr:transposase [Candidatus Omnitrophota bacterium]
MSISIRTVHNQQGGIVMSRPLRIEYPGAMYHVTSRGNEKKDIFYSPRDKDKFLEIISSSHDKFKIILHSFCLMTNHYHLLIETTKANLSKCMQFINSAYTNYFNKKRARYGHLFQHRYTGILVEEESYLIRLSRYLHLNPVRAKMSKKPEDFKWSSYKYFLNNKEFPDFLDIDRTLRFFDNDPLRYKEYVEEGLSGEIDNPLIDTFAGAILGRKEFIETVKKKYIAAGDIKYRDLPSLRMINNDILDPGYILNKLSSYTPAEITRKDKKKIGVYLLRKYTDLTLEEIASKMHFIEPVTATAAYKIHSRVGEQVNVPTKFNKLLCSFDSKLSNGEA